MVENDDSSETKNLVSTLNILYDLCRTLVSQVTNMDVGSFVGAWRSQARKDSYIFIFDNEE